MAAAEVPGIDVSKFQGTIDWPTIAPHAQFAYIKATEGATIVDKKFAANWAAAKGRLLRGAYHYLTWKTTPEAQADNFLAAVGPLDPGDLPPVLDLEEMAGIDQLTIPERAARVLRWLERVRTALKRIPVLYVQKSFMVAKFGDGPFFKDFPLFVVDISQSPPRLPGAWTTWTFWQHSHTGTRPGVTGPLDLDRFNGSLSDLLTFIQETTLP